MSGINERISGLSAERRELLRRAAGVDGSRVRVEPRPERIDALPLGRAQKAMWLVSQLAGGGVYNLPAAVRLRGALDLNALRAALNGVATRHEALRTVFPTRDGAPIQVVRAPASVPLTVGDVADEDELRRRALEEARRPFSLTERPCWRVVLFRLGPQDHVLLGVWHHLIWDGWSIGVFTRELAALYDAEVAGVDAELAPVPVHYGDFVLWEQEWLDTDANADWFVNALHGHVAVDMPGDRPRSPAQSFRGAMHFLELPADRVEQLDALCVDEGATPYMALLGLQAALLSRWCGQEKLVIGTPAANRNRSELESVIGYFANIMALPVTVEGSLRELLRSLKNTTGEAFSRQDVPFESLVERSGAVRDPSRNPLFQTMFALHAESFDALSLGGVAMEPFALGADTTHFDLGLHLWRKAGTLSGYWSYASDLFDSSTIARLSDQLLALLNAALDAPDADLHSLEVLSDTERAWLDRPVVAPSEGGTLMHRGGYPTGGPYLYDPPELSEPVAMNGQPLQPIALRDARGRLTPAGVPGRIHASGVATRDRGRWTPEGLLEVLGAWDRSTWHEGVRTPLADLEYRLRADPSVHDAWISAEPWVVYVVPRGPVVSARLQKLLPFEARFTLVDHLPVSASGAIDQLDLEALEVLDEGLRASWETALTDAGLPARVLLRDRQANRGLLHLGRLVKDWRRQAVESSSTIEVGHVEVDGGPLAYADGGALQLPEGAARTLTEALLRLSESDRGITVYEDDGQKRFIGYPQLIERARRVLTGLRAAGLGPGDRVMLQLGSLTDHFAVFWGCAFAGVISVCVANAPAWDRKGAVLNKLTNVWRAIGCPPMITSASLESSLHSAAKVYDTTFQLLLAETLLANEPADDIHPAKPTDVVFFQLTSGSTGVPKCIQETHDGIIHHVWGSAEFCGYTSDDVTVNWLPMDHVVPILTFHIKDVVMGVRQVHARTALVLADPLRWLDWLEEYKATHTWAPNFAFKLVNDALVPGRSWDLSAMKFFMNAGEQVTLPVVREFVTRLAPFGIATETMQPAFGMAEVCTCMTYANSFSPDTGAFHFTKDSLGGRLEDGDGISFIDLGPPMPGVEIRIALPDGVTTAPERVIGRFQIRGTVVTPGYLDNPVANGEAFVGDKWFDSGDLGFIADGRLALTGRAKEMIIVRGANLYCYEIESVVNLVEGVLPTFSAACSVDDPATGTEGLAVFFVPTEAATPCSRLLLQAVREMVTREFGVSPAVVLPLARDEFPKTTSGKIQRTRLKKRLAAGDFDERLIEVDLALGNAGSTVPDWFHEPVWVHEQARPAATDTTVHHIDSVEDALAALHTAEAGQHVFVARGALPVLPDDPAHLTALRGLLKSAEQELGIRCKLLDTDDVSVVEGELGDGAGEVAWRDGQRLVPRLRRVRVDAPGEELLGRDGLVLVTGGLGGIGQELARLLLEQGHAVLLTGRSALDGVDLGGEGLGNALSLAEKRDALAKLHGDVVYEAVDVLDREALAAAIGRAETRFGRTLSGAVHLAGVFPARLLKEETADSLALTLAPKIEGARVVSELAGDQPVLFMGSVYGHFGGTASGAYSASCSGLEGVAHERLSRGLPTVVMAPSNFDEVGMSRGYAWRDRSEALGWSMIERGRGLRSLRSVASMGRPVVVVGLDESKPNVARWLDTPSRSAQELVGLHVGAAPLLHVLDARGRPARIDLRRVERLDGDAGAGSGGVTLARSGLERTIAAAWREVLGVDPIDIDKSFFALGGQSIQLVQVLAKLQSRLGREIPVVELFKHPTVRELARFLEQGDQGDGKARLALAADRAKRQRAALKKRKTMRRPRR
jgi:acyl-CoA synthetase (AMP-forming)/AMP-acid ligase II/NAD(P)-dependent dehydrogenase (short-subunit alcohol dehydrogenase family)/acyl carrier protein